MNYDTTLEVKKTLATYQQVWNVSIVNALNGIPFTVNGDTLISPYSQSQWFVLGNSSAVSTSDNTVCGQSGDYYVTGIDANGCTAISDTIFVQCTTTGLADSHSPAPGILVLPNPFMDAITIYTEGINPALYNITIRNVLGQTVNKTNVNSSTSSFSIKLETDHLQNGIYFLIISSGNFSFSKKIIKNY